MENRKMCGYRFEKKTTINPMKSKNPLAKLTYKELQQVARELNLPIKFKHKVLLALVIAKKQDREDIVNIILNSNPGHKQKKSSKIVDNSSIPKQTSCDSDKAQFSGNISSLTNMVAENLHDLVWSSSINDYTFPDLAMRTSEAHTNLLLATPNVSFDSGNGSFGSFDTIPDEILLNDHELENSYVQEAMPTLPEENGSKPKNNLEISIVQVLEELSEY